MAMKKQATKRTIRDLAPTKDKDVKGGHNATTGEHMPVVTIVVR
jgi:hypothetical protein